MLYALEDAAKAKLPFYVLDRPNPVTGVARGRPAARRQPAQLHRLLRHAGAAWPDARRTRHAWPTPSNKWSADLHVVKMKNWQRGDWFDSTGLPWTDPSPNLRSLNAAALYDGLALLEASPNYSVGRGTDAPFEQIGADWIHGAELAQFLNNWVLPGVRVYPTKFQPESGPFKGKTDRRRPLRDRQSRAIELRARGPGRGVRAAAPVSRQNQFRGLPFPNRQPRSGRRSQVRRGPGQIEERTREQLQKFEDRRRPYLLY